MQVDISVKEIWGEILKPWIIEGCGRKWCRNLSKRTFNKHQYIDWNNLMSFKKNPKEKASQMGFIQGIPFVQSLKYFCMVAEFGG